MIRRLFVVLGLVLGLAAQAEAVTWGWLGVRIRDLSEQEMDEISQKHGLREGFGVLIVEVLKETPAAQSGTVPWSTRGRSSVSSPPLRWAKSFRSPCFGAATAGSASPSAWA